MEPHVCSFVFAVGVTQQSHQTLQNTPFTVLSVNRRKIFIIVGFAAKMCVPFANETIALSKLSKLLHESHSWRVWFWTNIFKDFVIHGWDLAPKNKNWKIARLDKMVVGSVCRCLSLQWLVSCSGSRAARESAATVEEDFFTKKSRRRWRNRWRRFKKKVKKHARKFKKVVKKHVRKIKKHVKKIAKKVKKHVKKVVNKIKNFFGKYTCKVPGKGTKLRFDCFCETVKSLCGCHSFFCLENKTKRTDQVRQIRSRGTSCGRVCRRANKFAVLVSKGRRGWNYACCANPGPGCKGGTNFAGSGRTICRTDRGNMRTFMCLCYWCDERVWCFLFMNVVGVRVIVTTFGFLWALFVCFVAMWVVLVGVVVVNIRDENLEVNVWEVLGARGFFFSFLSLFFRWCLYVFAVLVCLFSFSFVCFVLLMKMWLCKWESSEIERKWNWT